MSDFDAAHQLNSSFIYELPFGRTHNWGSGWNRAVDAALGGWSWSGLGRWTTGLPFNVTNGFDFPTNWQQNGLAVSLAKPKTGTYTDCAGDPTVFAAPNPHGPVSLGGIGSGPDGYHPADRWEPGIGRARRGRAEGQEQAAAAGGAGSGISYAADSSPSESADATDGAGSGGGPTGSTGSAGSSSVPTEDRKRGDRRRGQGSRKSS